MILIEPKYYAFSELKNGLKESFELTISEEMINNFAKNSGDYNPLHINDDFAKTTKFKKKICHGMLLASFFSRLIGMYIPGKNSLYFSQTLNFIQPCYIGEKILVEGEVIDKSESTKILTVKTTIQNNSENTIVDGIAKVIFLE